MLEEVPVLLLSRAEAEEKHVASSPAGDYLLLVDPETLVARFVRRDERGVVTDMQGHEDLFPLDMVLEGVLKAAIG